MSSPWPQARAGEPLRIPASAWNDALAAADDFRARRDNVAAGDPGEPLYNPASVQVRCATDQLGLYHVAALPRPTFTPGTAEAAFLSELTLDAVAPSGPGDTGALGVLLEPVNDGEMGRAAVAGIVPVRLVAEDEPAAGDRVGFVADKTDRLAVDPTGPALILWVGGEDEGDPGDGLVWALVLLGAAGDPSFWFKVTERGKHVDGCWIYGGVEQIKRPKCGWTDGPRTGSVGAWVEAKLVSPAGGLADGETWGVMVHGATSGRFKLSESSETDWIAWDASASDIADALVAAGSNLVGDGTLTFDDELEHTIEWTKNELKPGPSNYAVEVNDQKVDPLNTRERVWPGWVARPQITITKTQAGTGVLPSKFSVVLSGVAGGTYTLTFTLDGVDYDTAPLDWNADAAAVEAAITAAAGATVSVSAWTQTAGGVTYTVTFGSSLLDYEASADGSLLTGDTNFAFRWGGPPTGPASFPPKDVPTICMQVLLDYSLDTSTCIETKTFGYIKIPANWLGPGGVPYGSSGACAAGST